MELGCWLAEWIQEVDAIFLWFCLEKRCEVLDSSSSFLGRTTLDVVSHDYVVAEIIGDIPKEDVWCIVGQVLYIYEVCY